uniref:Uncharacterized protein n=1 Tax=Anopheles coluzzii TaxID=1518534 RepID=A0A8W7P686_ANOCL
MFSSSIFSSRTMIHSTDEEELIVLVNRQTIVHYNLHPLAILPEAKVKQPRIVIGLELSIVQRDDTLEQLLMGGRQPFEQIRERWPLFGRWIPALRHNAVHGHRAALGCVEPTATRYQLHHVPVGQAGVGHQAQAEHLPQQHPERPHVRLGGEDTVQERFRWHPLDRQHRLATLAVVVGAVDVTGHTEVGNLHHPARPFAAEQTVPGGDVPVDEALALHVPAALRYIQRTEDQILHR